MAEHKKSLRKDFRRLKKSFLYAVKGIKEVFQREQNIKIQLVLTLVVIYYGLFLHIGSLEFAILFVAIAQVLSLETINTAFEIYLDEKEKEQSETIAVIKDILAAGVLVSVIFAVIIGSIIFLPPSLKLLGV